MPYGVNKMSSPRFVTGGQLALALSVTPETIRRWRISGLIPSMRINSTTIRYDIEQVVAELKRRRPARAPASECADQADNRIQEPPCEGQVQNSECKEALK